MLLPTPRHKAYAPAIEVRLRMQRVTVGNGKVQEGIGGEDLLPLRNGGLLPAQVLDHGRGKEEIHRPAA